MTTGRPAATHDPVTWSILADWYADQGDAEKETEWRERADLARKVLDSLVRISWKRSAEPQGMGVSGEGWYAMAWRGPKVIEVRVRIVVGSRALGQDVCVNAGSFRVRPEPLQAVFPPGSFRFQGISVGESDTKYIASKLVQIVDAAVEAAAIAKRYADAMARKGQSGEVEP